MRHRHLQRRAKHDAAAHAASSNAFDMSQLQSAAAAADASLDTEWARIQELLSGLLDVTVDARFQLEPQHAHASWLVLYLTRVENAQPQSKGALPRRIGAVLGAVATLCAAAERLRLRATDHAAFWTRVLTSQMMARPLDSGDVAIWWFANHTRAREVRIKLKWSSRKVEKALLAPIETFLNADWHAYDRIPSGDRTLRLRSMRVAICVTHTQLTVKDMELLGNVLARRDMGTASSSAKWLFQDSIASLEISHTVLHVNTLRAIASRVYPKAKPIDELRLEAIFGSRPLADPSAVVTPEYTTAFKSVLVAAFDITHCNNRVRSGGLSLAHNSLQFVHLQILFDVLRSATRDLTSLSLEHALGIVNDTNPKLSLAAMKALEAIAFRTSNPSGRLDDECEFDLSGSCFGQSETTAFLAALAVRTTRTLPVIQQALAKGKRVTCRVLVNLSVEREQQEDEDELVANQDYLVISISENTTIEIVIPTTNATVGITRIIHPTAIAQLAVDAIPLFQSRFTRLILDGDPSQEHRPGTSSCGCANGALLTALGPRLTFLSMRGYVCVRQHQLHRVIAPCSVLQHLTLEGSDGFCNPGTEWFAVFDALRVLKTLNLSATRSTSHIIGRLINALVETPNLQLTRLSLTQNKLRDRSLPQLQLLLDVHPTLQLLEMDSIGQPNNVDAYITGRRDLARDYHGVVVDTTPLQPRSKLAFLSVIATLCDGYLGVEPCVLRNIFEMAQDVVTRQILWRGAT